MTNCLFPLWHQKSAPLLHTSAFWPAFDESAVRRFLDGVDARPVASRPLNVAAVTEARSRIESFLEEINDVSEAAYSCKSAYVAFEKERLMSLSLIAAVADGLSAVQHASLSGDGSDSDLRMTESLQHLKQHVILIKPKTPEASEARQYLLSEWRDIIEANTLDSVFKALESYRVQLRSHVMAKYAFVPELVDAEPEPMLPSERVTAILMTALAEVFGPDRAGWCATLVEGAPNVHISYDAKAVVIPAGRTYAKDHVKALIIHEIGVHVVRSVNGSGSKEPLAGYGLVGYGPSEEALGALMQHALRDSFDLTHALTAVGILHFATAGPDRTFREVHTFVQALLTCMANPSPEALAKADFGRAAFSRTIRMMRLGNGMVVDRSLVKYWRGLLLLHDYFAAHPVQEQTLAIFFAGKYDPLNNAQYRLITEHFNTYINAG